MEETQATVDNLHQPQDTDEEADLAMTESLVYSGMESLATADDTLNQDEECRLVEAVKNKLSNKENVAIKIGRRLHEMSEEIDSAINLNPDIQRALRIRAWDQLKQYFMGASEQIVGSDKNISEGRILIIIMLGYGLIRRFLKLLLGEGILEFIEKIVKFVYEVFKKYGILNWISKIGGWAALAARRMDYMIILEIYNGIPSGIWGIIGVGAAAITAFCMYKAVTV